LPGLTDPANGAPDPSILQVQFMLVGVLFGRVFLR